MLAGELPGLLPLLLEALRLPDAAIVLSCLDILNLLATDAPDLLGNSLAAILPVYLEQCRHQVSTPGNAKTEIKKEKRGKTKGKKKEKKKNKEREFKCSGFNCFIFFLLGSFFFSFFLLFFLFFLSFFLALFWPLAFFWLSPRIFFLLFFSLLFLNYQHHFRGKK